MGQCASYPYSVLLIIIGYFITLPAFLNRMLFEIYHTRGFLSNRPALKIAAYMQNGK
jgi:hypothetical protein